MARASRQFSKLQLFTTSGQSRFTTTDINWRKNIWTVDECVRFLITNWQFALHLQTNFWTSQQKLNSGKELRKAIFSVFYNISPLIFGNLILLKGSFREFRYFVWIYLDQKLVYNANRPLWSIAWHSYPFEVSFLLLKVDLLSFGEELGSTSDCQ